MTAIILAAGVGKRLAETLGGRPKCLVEIGGRSLLTRLVDGLRQVGVTSIVVVTGHGAEAVRLALAGTDVSCLFNPRFREGAILSLWTARDHLEGPALVMDADVLCPVSMLRRLVESPHENCVLMDAAAPSTGEEQMLLVRDGRVRDIVRGGAPGWELAGESVGFLKVGARGAAILRRLLEERVAAGETDIEHEQVYPALFERVAVGVERVDGEPWIEIDFPDDVRDAEARILPRLETP